MSHFTQIKTSNQFINPELLIKALNDLGYQNIVYHPKAQDLQDYEQVRGERPKSQAKANIIVPYKGNEQKIHSDLGYIEQDGIYQLVADEMDSSKLTRQFSELQQAYNTHKVEAMIEEVKKTASKLNKGEPQIEIVKQDNRTKIRIAYPADLRRHNQLQQQTLRR